MTTTPPLATGQPDEGSATGAWRSFGRLAIVVFSTCHAVKLLAGIIPEPQRPDPVPWGLAHAYECLTGSRQKWDMFASIPSHHHYGARIVVIGVDGQERELGPLLPGFRAYPSPDPARIYALFMRMFGGYSDGTLQAAYLRRVDEELRGSKQILPEEKWCLETNEDFTRLLARIRSDGRLFDRRTRRLFPTPAPLPPASSAAKSS